MCISIISINSQRDLYVATLIEPRLIYSSVIQNDTAQPMDLRGHCWQQSVKL